MITINDIKEKYVLDPTFAEEFIRRFNDGILKYGWISLVDVLEIIDFKYKPSYLDFKYGWKDQINMEQNLIVTTKRNHIECILNLPEMEIID